jgi:hypothetical protein
MPILQLHLTNNLYLKNPQSTDLGRKIVSQSIVLIDELGFELFTFRKLSQHIDSTEASIYRYFENKHRLLIYLIAWYWSWIEYQIDYETHHLTDPNEKLRVALRIISSQKKFDYNFPDIDEVALQQIVIAESEKTYHTKAVDDINKSGVFKGYKSVCKILAGLIAGVNPDFPFPYSLASSVMEISNQQPFYSLHLPSLTDVKPEGDIFSQNLVFLEMLVFKTIER